MTEKVERAKAAWWRTMPITAWIFLLGMWALLSGHFDIFYLGIGFASVTLIAWLHSRLPASPEARSPSLRGVRLPLYGLWLFWQMVLSALYVARVIINPNKHLDPRLIAFRSKQPSLLSHVIFANSITLTPGTLTVDLEADQYLVHALTPETADATVDGKMASRVARLSSDEAIGTPESFPPEEMMHLP